MDLVWWRWCWRNVWRIVSLYLVLWHWCWRYVWQSCPLCCGDQVVCWCWRARWYFWCALGVDVLGDILGEVHNNAPSETWRLKPKLTRNLAHEVSLKRSVKIAAVEDNMLRCSGWWSIHICLNIYLKKNVSRGLCMMYVLANNDVFAFFF